MMKSSGPATDWEEVQRHEGGGTWIAYPGETMQRASHALVVDGEVWVVDPVDAVGLDDYLADFGDVAGVVVLFDRHRRDSAEIATRHDVSVWVPECMDGVAPELDAPVERFRYELADTGYVAYTLVDNRFWQEAILYSDERNVLVVPESVGTAAYFRTSSEPLGVHPMMRVRPPRKLARFEPDRLLVGHGAGIPEDAADALATALDGSRRRTPTLVAKNLKNLVFG